MTQTTLEALTKKLVSRLTAVRVRDKAFANESGVLFLEAYNVDYKTKYALQYIEFGYRKTIDLLGTTPIEVLPQEERKNILKSEPEIITNLGQRLACTLGCDPEIFVTDCNGKVVPAWSILPKKGEGLRYVTNEGYDGEVYYDGFQAEFTTSPLSCLSYEVDCVQAALKLLYNKAVERKNLLSIKSVLPVDLEFLKAQDKEFVEFGCAPSKNVYSLVGNTTDGREVPYRFAGGHIHVGLTRKQKAARPIEDYIRALDMILGVASVSLLGKLDFPIRRQFYGLPGEYRTPAHGFEYRVLSNAWLCHPLAMNLVFELARGVCGLIQDDILVGWQADQQETIDILLKNDIRAARRVLRKNQKMLQDILQISFQCRPERAALATEIWLRGISCVVKDPTDLITNWRLTGDWRSHSESDGTGFKHVTELPAKKKARSAVTA